MAWWCLRQTTYAPPATACMPIRATPPVWHVDLWPQAGNQGGEPADERYLTEVGAGPGEEPVVGAGLVGDPEVDLHPVPEPEAGDLPGGDQAGQGEERDDDPGPQRPHWSVL